MEDEPEPHSKAPNTSPSRQHFLHSGHFQGKEVFGGKKVFGGLKSPITRCLAAISALL